MHSVTRPMAMRYFSPFHPNRGKSRFSIDTSPMAVPPYRTEVSAQDQAKLLVKTQSNRHGHAPESLLLRSIAAWPNYPDDRPVVWRWYEVPFLVMSHSMTRIAETLSTLSTLSC